MSYTKYVEGKYSCNHPESDFVDNSTEPIEMKRDNFTEYTRRNETSNFQFDVWNSSNSTTRINENRINYNKEYSKNETKKSGGGKAFWIILFVIYGIPMILDFLTEILEEIL